MPAAQRATQPGINGWPRHDGHQFVLRGSSQVIGRTQKPRTANALRKDSPLGFGELRGIFELGLEAGFSLHDDMPNYTLPTVSAVVFALSGINSRLRFWLRQLLKLETDLGQQQLDLFPLFDGKTQGGLEGSLL